MPIFTVLITDYLLKVGIRYQSQITFVDMQYEI